MDGRSVENRVDIEVIVSKVVVAAYGRLAGVFLILFFVFAAVRQTSIQLTDVLHSGCLSRLALRRQLLYLLCGRVASNVPRGGASKRHTVLVLQIFIEE